MDSSVVVKGQNVERLDDILKHCQGWVMNNLGEADERELKKFYNF